MDNVIVTTPEALEALITKAIDRCVMRLSTVQAPATSPKEIITPEVLRQRLNISQPTEIKWRKKGKLPSLNIGTAIRYEWGAVLSALSNSK